MSQLFPNRSSRPAQSQGPIIDVVDEGPSQPSRSSTSGPVVDVGADGQRPSASAMRVSFAVALAGDLFQLAFPPLWFLADAVVLVVLLMVWGRRSDFILPLIVEVIPGISVFPTWTLVVWNLKRKLEQS